jgi:hypothetical protein
MSSADSFLPYPVPAPHDEKPDDYESEIDVEEGLDEGANAAGVDVDESEISATTTSFRRPTPGQRLTPEQLEADEAES